MDRLTYDATGTGQYIQRCASTKQDLIDRLAAYEDTGLEPEQIKHIVEINNEYVKASEEGRLIVLPSDPYEMADVAQEILSRACRLQRVAEAAMGGGGDG